MKNITALLITVSALTLTACTKTDTAVQKAGVAIANTANPQGSLSSQINVPFTKTILDNGLTVIVHEDPKAPLVSVNIWYKVGSRDEKKGKTGYAHLFEHLMFNGSEHADFDFFKQLNAMGATSFNGTTDPDRTNYFETVPKSSLDQLLWLEADRMGYLLGTLTQEKLDEQRGVVKNEKRQGDNRPYSIGEYRMLEGLLPAGHPYRWSTIGSMDDLNAAKISDLTKWFDEYYGAGNAVLVLAGDIKADEGLAMARKYFGHIRPGPVVSRMKEWVPIRTENVFDETVDEVSVAMVDRTWAVPGMTNPTSGPLYIAASILGDGKTSRMYEELVEKRKLASEVYVQYRPQALMGFFSVTVLLKSGVDANDVNSAVDEVMAEFFAKGPSKTETQRAIKSILVSFMKSQEVIGGFSGKGPTLAEGEVFFGDPGSYKMTMGWIEAANADNMRALKNDVFSNGYYQLITRPNGKYKAASLVVDLNKMPALGVFPKSHFPKIQTAALKNGMKVSLVERHTIPTVRMSMQFNAGSATDVMGKSGLAGLTAKMLKEGTDGLASKDIIFKLNDMASQIYAYADSDASVVALSSLKDTLDETLDLYADIIRTPRFDGDALAKLKEERLSNLTQAMGNANAKVSYYMPELLFGKNHPYGRNYLGMGTQESITSISVDDLKAHYEMWMRPDNAHLIVVGDITLDEVMPMLENKFGSWTGEGAPMPTKIFPAIPSTAGHVYVIDKPGAVQTVITAALVVPKDIAGHEADMNVMNRIVGGGFLSRINMKLREEKGWTYGASSSLDNKKQAVIWEVSAPVQADKTKESLIEIKKILRGYTTSNLATSSEIETALDGMVNSTAGKLERSSSILSMMSTYQSQGKPLNYFSKLQGEYGAIQQNNIHQIAKDVIDMSKLTWVIAGDLDKIKADIQAANIGEITVIGSE